jgi:hypothetical protein
MPAFPFGPSITVREFVEKVCREHGVTVTSATRMINGEECVVRDLHRQTVRGDQTRVADRRGRRHENHAERAQVMAG